MARQPRELKDTHVRNLKPAAPGTRYEHPDSEVRGLLIRVTDKGTKSFIFYTRYPGNPAPARRSLGEYGSELTLAKAREKARQWKEQIKVGIDPRAEQEQRRAAEQEKRGRTFAKVAEDFIAEKLPRERSGRAVERELRKDLIPALGHIPITEITDLQVLAIINAKKRQAPVQARNLLALAKRLFNWTIDQRTYGIKSNPCRDLKAAKLIGDPVPRDHTLTDGELRALWLAAARLGYPHGHAYRLLALTALRLNEVADATWSEIDTAKGEWTIPAARMKGKNGKARAHVVPLTADILKVLDDVPQFDGGEFVFSTTEGRSPTWLGDNIKKEMDALMVEELRSQGARLRPWRNHDLRRTIRTHLSRLKITEVAREALLAHVRPGIVGTYDRHQYYDEKKEALELWAAELRGIVDPPAGSAKVLSLRRR